MKNKNKKIYGKILATALVSVVVFLLNMGVVGAAEVLVDGDCYDKYYNNVEKYPALGENCEKCIVDPDKLHKEIEAECKASTNEAATACTTGDVLASYCDTLTGSKQTECKTCADKEPGPDRDSCKGNFDTSGFIEKCEKKYDDEYEDCLINGEFKCDICMGKLDAAATGGCKLFTEFIDEIKSEVNNNYENIYAKNVNECFDYEIDDEKLQKCQTNDITLINKCGDDALKKKSDADKVCVDTKKEALKVCEQQQKSFIDQLCTSAINITACKERNQNTILAIYGQCSNPVEETAKACLGKAGLEYQNEINICYDKDFMAIKDKQCFDEIAIAARKECIPECGDGFISKEYGEECDDGNKVDDDACSNSCKKSTCGNKIVESGEECDDGEGLKSEKEDKGDGCFRCKRENVFRVAEVLKIDEGQTYLERGDGEHSLRNGIYYFIITAIEVATKIIGALALLMVIVGGLIMMISSGNSQLQQKGKRIILYSILGLVIAFLSLVIVTFVQSLFYTT